MNPCEDVFRGARGGRGGGSGGRAGGETERDCTESQRSRYYAKISGPLLDRIDIQVEVCFVKRNSTKKSSRFPHEPVGIFSLNFSAA
jgi:hypothetical protein